VSVLESQIPLYASSVLDWQTKTLYCLRTIKKLYTIAAILTAIAVTGCTTNQNEDTDMQNDQYIGNSAEECARIQVMCIEGMERFDDKNGCGCQPVAEQDDMNIYESEDMGFSMKYDPSLTVQEDSEKEVRLYRNGPTQTGQTEMYDGMMLSIQKIDAPDGVQSYIDTQVGLVSESATVTTPLHEDILNGLQTQTFSASGLGDFTTIYIPLDDSTLFELSYMIVDPTGVGFQEMMDAMLSSMNPMR